jgi:YVTN family beta-propeller protein
VAGAAAGAGSGIADPTDTEIYVANSGGDSLSIISAKRRAVIATIAVPGGPLALVAPNANGVLYVGTRSGAIVAVGLSDHRVLGTLLQLHGSAAAQMDYDALTGAVYVPDAAAGVVEVLRPASAGAGNSAHLPAEPERTLPFSGGPVAAAITFDGAYGFVATQQTGLIVQFDAVTRTTLATLAVGGAPRARSSRGRIRRRPCSSRRARVASRPMSSLLSS